MSILNNPDLGAIQRKMVRRQFDTFSTKEKGASWFLSGLEIGSKSLSFVTSIGLVAKNFFHVNEQFDNLINYLSWLYVVSTSVLIFLAIVVCSFILLLTKVAGSQAKPYQLRPKEAVDYHELMLSTLMFERPKSIWSKISNKFFSALAVINILCLVMLGWTFWTIILTILIIGMYVLKASVTYVTHKYFLNLDEATAQFLATTQFLETTR
jgi:membrane-associated HD superfamily phosphohydrolase